MPNRRPDILRTYKILSLSENSDIRKKKKRFYLKSIEIFDNSNYLYRGTAHLLYYTTLVIRYFAYCTYTYKQCWDYLDKTIEKINYRQRYVLQSFIFELNNILL